MMYENLHRYRPIVDDWEAFIASLERPLPMCAWANELKASRDEVIERLAADGIEARPLAWHTNAFLLPDGFKPGRRIEHMMGLYQVQEEAALVPIEFLELGRGKRVLDLCAAPGNKTAQIAARLENTGTVVANDRNYQRIRAVRNTADRLGLLNIVATHQDGVNIPESGSDSFDSVLADVPCTCEGTSRKNPKALNVTLDQIHRIANTQRALLRKSFLLARPGGRVVYSTCTYAPEENEAVIADVLSALDFEPIWIDLKLEGFRSSPGLLEWEGRVFPAGMDRAMRVWPHHNDTGGFFVAAWDIPEAV